VLKALANYAATPSNSRGRLYPEAPPGYRTEFQRDRDRIIHSAAFRRLVYKTQVFVNHEGDLYRTRLTHSLEVAQIARTITRAMGLNEDLVEAISLAHDLGHTPFGHAGQNALNECMRDFGGFEHNLQSLRVVDQLEDRYPEFPGLNLTFEAREGILKHCSLANARQLGELGQRFIKRQQPTLEAQIANIADQIAYNNHDIDDGLRSGLIKISDLTEMHFFSDELQITKQKYPKISERHQAKAVIRRMIGSLVTDLIETSVCHIQALEPDSIDMVRQCKSPLIGFSDTFLEAQKTLQLFLRENLYNHPKVRKMTDQAHEIVSTLFSTFLADYKRMPHEHAINASRAHQEIGLNGSARIVADYVAGMTDRFALQVHEGLKKQSKNQ
jgi:dGTPase